jgi:Smg protein
MNENVLDILMYLFENYFSEPMEDEPDQRTLETELVEAGFAEPNVRKAFTWLEGLAEQQSEVDEAPGQSPSRQAVRVFTADEAHKLSRDARGFLVFLEDTGVVDPATRELVIDRLMALDIGEIDTEALSWVLLMVLHNSPGQEGAYVWVEDMIFDRMDGVLH